MTLSRKGKNNHQHICITHMEHWFHIFWVKSNHNTRYNYSLTHHHHLLFLASVHPFGFKYLHLTNHILHHLFHCYICQYYDLYLLIDFVLLILDYPHHLISCYTQCMILFSYGVCDNAMHMIEFILNVIFVILVHLSPILLTMLHFNQWCNLWDSWRPSASQPWYLMLDLFAVYLYLTIAIPGVSVLFMDDLHESQHCWSAKIPNSSSFTDATSEIRACLVWFHSISCS